MEPVKRETLNVIFSEINHWSSRSTLCACGRPRRDDQRKCNECHATYMREWRKSHPLNPEQRKKDNARSYAGVYKRRGNLKKMPCERCASDDSQMHHENYDQPLNVTWLCHLELHTEATIITIPRVSA